MSEHTPGPWHYQPKESAVMAGASETVAELQFCLPLGRTTANGCLIAAAPDLLNGCNALLGLMQIICVRDDVPSDIRRIFESGNHRIEEARAAITKATG